MHEVGPGVADNLRVVIMVIGEGNHNQGCGYVFDTPNGAFFEYTLGWDNVGKEYQVFRTHVAEDVTKQFGHLLAFTRGQLFCKTIGCMPPVWEKKARGTLAQRVACIQDLAAVYGWSEIDDDPLTLSEPELCHRWRLRFQEGAVGDASAPAAALAQALLVVLLGRSPTRYWELFQRDFPLVPQDALSNPHNPWWQQHGGEVVSDLVKVLKSICPPGTVFEVREGQWGFWLQGEQLLLLES